MFTGHSTAQEFRPFATRGIPALETVYVTNFTANIASTTGSINLILDGDFHCLGSTLKSTLAFVTNDKGEQGVYINAPLTNDKKLHNSHYYSKKKH